MKKLNLLCIGILILIAIPSVSALTISVETPSDPVPVGKAVKIPVTVKDAENINGFLIYYPNNSSLMSVEAYGPDKNSSGLGGLLDISYNSVRYVSTESFSGNHVLFYINVTPLVEQNMSVDISVDDLVTITENGTLKKINDFKVENGSLKIKKSVVENPTVQPTSSATVQPTTSPTVTPTLKPTAPGTNTTDPKPTDNNSPSEGPKIPGFEFLFALMSFGAAGILSKRRK